MFCIIILACSYFNMLPVLAHEKVQKAGRISLQSTQIDLSSAVLILAPGMFGPEIKASEMLLDEVEKRSWVHWPIANQLPESCNKGIVLGQRKDLIRTYPALAEKPKDAGNDKPEGYRIVALESGLVVVAGNDTPGSLFGLAECFE